jgi:hypothetical protein
MTNSASLPRTAASEDSCHDPAGMKVGAHRAVHRRAPWSTRPQALFRIHFVALRRERMNQCVV